MIGKTVSQRTYLHVSGLAAADPVVAAWVAEAEDRAGVRRAEHFNVVRYDLAAGQIALLDYPGFFDDPFPSLAASWLVDLDAGTIGYRTYADSQNPPILHRKELLLPVDHPQRAEFAALTQACESIGLFDEPTRIGYRRQWLDLVRERGYRVDGPALVPLGNDEGDAADEGGDGRVAQDLPDGAAALPVHQWSGGTQGGWQAARQLTAMVRYGFSAPIQALARHGFLDGRFGLFDYGCGRGDDLRGLAANGLAAAGWDPWYAPDQAIHAAPIVNLGFVINVIEDREERLEALTRAWLLAETLLVVSVMLANQGVPRGTEFRDGVLTRRGTFQRYYTQAEIRAYLAEALDEEPIPVAPGVLFVFRDKDAEQRFLIDRFRSRRRPSVAPWTYPRPHRTTAHTPRPRPDPAAERYAAYEGPLDRLWGQWLALGRPPEPAEWPAGDDLAALTAGFSSVPKALRFLKGHQDAEALARAAATRRADLLVYLALNQFERRRPYRHLEPGLQRDIKALCGDYTAAQAQARDLLFSIRDTQAIADAAREAAERGLGWLEPGESLQLPTGLVEQLPPLLRVYVGCAAALFGDYREADLVKIHIGSGKLSLLRYDAFADRPLPRLVERVKIRLREQDIDFYTYSDDTGYPSPYLYHKSRYINEEFPHYPEQAAFEAALDTLGLFDLSGFGPSAAVFDETLARHRWMIDGFALRRPDSPPDLDAPCGRFLRFRQLIECGETQDRTGLPNLPRRPQTWDALQDLAEQVLDPVIDWFGMIRLTYGFCSPELAREIPARIDPRLDQHAAYEHNRLGKPICPRLGAAVDFLVADEDMREVARWVAQHTPFDRLYFYGPDLPIHVSYGPDHSRQIV
ncbi:MAG TPA: DNA phosphorothioation-associated putative methyltransferase, partial [Lamprocystis sp. (in: g-proteobacteria)]|nr:DNA phosphorothioation-associated putative methyltransferase [Lamprocystis sp. (in: g-proteobacteria)]